MPQETEAYGFAGAELVAEALGEAEAEAEVFDALGEALALLAEALAEVLTVLALGALEGEALEDEAEALASEVAWAGTRSAVAWFGVVVGWVSVIAAATPLGPPTTVPASAATVIAGYLRVQDEELAGSVRVIGLLRPCFDLL